MDRFVCNENAIRVLQEKYFSGENTEFKSLFSKFLNISVVRNNINFIVNRYAYSYAMPEIDVSSDEFEDYISQLKLAYIEGMSNGILKYNFQKIAKNNVSAIMSFLTKEGKHAMLYGQYGVLNYMKSKYPDITEYYLKLLIQAHKAGFTGFICEEDTDRLAAFYGSYKTAATMQKVFTPIVENLSLTGKYIYEHNMNKELPLFYKLIRLLPHNEFSKKDINRIKGETIVINKAKKIFKEYLNSIGINKVSDFSKYYNLA